MKPNVGTLDRSIRAVIGLGILALYFVLQGDARWLALIGAVPLATAVLGWCPAYLPFGLNTCKPGEQS